MKVVFAIQENSHVLNYAVKYLSCLTFPWQPIAFMRSLNKGYKMSAWWGAMSDRHPFLSHLRHWWSVFFSVSLKICIHTRLMLRIIMRVCLLEHSVFFPCLVNGNFSIANIDAVQDWKASTISRLWPIRAVAPATLLFCVSTPALKIRAYLVLYNPYLIWNSRRTFGKRSVVQKIGNLRKIHVSFRSTNISFNVVSSWITNI